MTMYLQNYVQEAFAYSQMACNTHNIPLSSFHKDNQKCLSGSMYNCHTSIYSLWSYHILEERKPEVISPIFMYSRLSLFLCSYSLQVLGMDNLYAASVKPAMSLPVTTGTLQTNGMSI